jgi:D-amino peptidase
LKIFISVDMEGVAGVTHASQCRPGHPDYPRYRHLMTEEVRAAVEGASEAGATEFVVNDSHFAMTNVLIEGLPAPARLLSGSTKLSSQMEGLDATFDGVFFVGYHQGDGVGDGVLNHTLMSATIREVRIDSEVVDEAGINARVAGSYGVPVALLTGDESVCADARANLGDIEVAAVKQDRDRLSALHQPIAVAHDLIRRAAARATTRLSRKELSPLVPGEPSVFEVEFRSTSSAHMCTLFPGVERIGARTVRLGNESFLNAYRMFWGLGIFAAAVQDGVFGQA